MAPPQPEGNLRDHTQVTHLPSSHSSHPFHSGSAQDQHGATYVSTQSYHSRASRTSFSSVPSTSGLFFFLFKKELPLLSLCEPPSPHLQPLYSGEDSSAPRPCQRPLISLWQSGACWLGSFLMHGARPVVPPPLHWNSFDKRITAAGIVELPHMIYPGTTNSIHQTGRQSFWTWNKNMQTSRLVCPDYHIQSRTPL